MDSIFDYGSDESSSSSRSKKRRNVRRRSSERSSSRSRSKSSSKSGSGKVVDRRQMFALKYDDDAPVSQAASADVEDRLNAILNRWKEKTEEENAGDIEDESVTCTLDEEANERAYKMALNKHFQRHPEIGALYRDSYWQLRVPDVVKEEKRRPRRGTYPAPRRLFY